MHIHESRECRPTVNGGCGDCPSKGRLTDGPFCLAYGRLLCITTGGVLALLQCIKDERLSNSSMT
ncbi:MAG: hypothetical protein BWY43_00368 [candidate division WS2 bacterium ADurb.Bin280]|uniref:Uncharacterized protein n=1 Tax=candidate division WS2 bacterium ADurb.Bin280 TaxID=1852829 RepID=A0A1V5SDU9_9BACT|nr:MAG: hypothetical protein BWY43_00368 [candidate division WS2 bacterium ADurb.Bin280]